MSNFKDLMRFDAKSCESQADELRRWSRQFNRTHHKFQTKPVGQIIASPESGFSCYKPVDSVTVTPSDEPAVTVSSICHDSPESGIRHDKVDKCETVAVMPCEEPPVSTSSTCPEPEIKCDKVGNCDAAASELLYDGPATITSSTCPACPDNAAKSQLNGCDQRQDTPKVMEPRTGSDEQDNVKNEILALEMKLLNDWNCSSQNLLLKKKEEEIFLLLKRVDLLEDTCREKDKIIMKYEKKLDILSEQDQAMWELQEQQKNLVCSLMAKVSLEKKTKFIQGTHKLRYHRTATAVPVERELVKASTRLLEERHKKQKEDVDKLVSIVDTIAVNYPAAPSAASADRYSFRSIVLTNTVVQPDDEFCMTKLYKAICLFALDTTKVEDDEYDAFLREQDRPPIIYSPVMPKPRVEWGLINTNIHRNLPKPFPFPINGAAENPDFYTEIEPGVASLKFNSGRPFGVAFGFRTSCGILPVPDEPVKGYMWDGDTKDWVIAAFY